MSAIESEFETMSLDSRGEERMKPTMGEYLKSQTSEVLNYLVVKHLLAHNRSDHTAQILALDDSALGLHIELKAFKSYLYNDLITLYDTMDPLDQKELYNSCFNFMKHLNSNGSQHQHPMVTESMFKDFFKKPFIYCLSN